MKRKIFFYLLLVLINSCKNNKEEKKNNTQTSISEQEILLDENIKAIKQGLDNYWQVDAPNEAKIIVNKDKIFYIMENPSLVDTTSRYFLHIKLINGELINMDFNYKDHVLKRKDQGGFKEYAIAYRELPQQPIFSILTGQFNENGRLWQKILHKQNFN